MDVSIIIVNYNTKNLLKNCLTSIYRQVKEISFEIIVSDNGSTDGSQELITSNFPEVILIENNANLGFGAANNKALQIAKGNFIFYLNSDTILLNNAPSIFLNYWNANYATQNLGAIGANLLDKENNVIHSSGEFAGYKLSIKQLLKMGITNFALSIFYILHISPAKFTHSEKCPFYTGPVDYITGADLFLKNDSFAKYDENFFLYFEEADLQRHMSLQKKNRMLIDGPLIQHLCGGTVGNDFSIKRKASFSRIQFELSRIKFLKKYNSNSFLLFITKLLVTINWLNPFLFGNTKHYLKQLWKI